MSGRSLNSDGVWGYELEEKMTSDMFIDALLLFVPLVIFVVKIKRPDEKSMKLKRDSKSSQGFLSVLHTEN